MPAGDTWHPATDQLDGTNDVYGTEGGAGAWTVKWNDADVKEFMFATGVVPSG